MLDPNFDPLTELKITAKRLDNVEPVVNQLLITMTHNAELIKLLLDSLRVMDQRLKVTESQVRSIIEDKIK